MYFRQEWREHERSKDAVLADSDFGRCVRYRVAGPSPYSEVQNRGELGVGRAHLDSLGILDLRADGEYGHREIVALDNSTLSVCFRVRGHSAEPAALE
jgi:hypothetical protein